MKTKKLAQLLGVFVALLLILVPKGFAQPAQMQGGPVITHAYAVSEGHYGTIWKIYIEADDPNGQMLRIASVVDETGYGLYPTDFTYIKSKDSKHFKGYLQWNTFSSKAAYMNEWQQLTVTITVQDKSGRWSNEVVFPFTFQTGVHRSDTPPDPFNVANLPKLGNVMVELFNPADLGSGGNFSSN
jgi:hypothetical protein